MNMYGQMPKLEVNFVKNQYIVQMTDNRLIVIYHSDTSGIVMRTFDNGRWSKPIPVAPDMQENFTLSTDDRGTLYMFCRNNSGDMHLYRQQRGEWSSRVMLENTENKQPKFHAYPMIFGNRMSIIYSHSSGGSGTLMLRRIDEHGKWHTPITIDSYTPINGDFSVQAISPTHHLLFYAKKNADSANSHAIGHSIGYVETDPERVTAFNTIYSTNQRITDTSFLVTNSSIHALFIVKSMFSTQVIYRKKSGANFSAPIVIAEAPQISNCLLMFVSGKLHAYFMSGGQLASVTSADFGETFSGVSRCTNKFCVSPVKSAYISQIPMDESTYFVRQLFVDRNNAADIQLLPDMYEDFYPLPAAASADTQPAAVPNSAAASQKPIHEELALLQDKLDIAQMQLEEKERRIVKHMHAHNDEKAKLLEKIKQLESNLSGLQVIQQPTAPNPSANTRKYPLMIV